MSNAGISRNNPTSIGEPDKVTSWPFKEPEKTTSWKDEPIKDVPVELVDRDLRAALKRTELIKARMSPPGELKLPPRLEAARFKYGIPDGAFRSQASFDRIYVFPLDLHEGDSKVPGTMIHRPNLTRMKDMQEGNRGVLISAGLTAADRLMSHGYELGDVVSTNKNVPFARRCENLEGDWIFYLVMRDGDLAGNETLREDLLSGARAIIDAGSDGEYCHQIAGRKKQSVFISENW